MLGAIIVRGGLQRAEQEIEILGALGLGQLGRRFRQLLLLFRRRGQIILRQRWRKARRSPPPRY